MTTNAPTGYGQEPRGNPHACGLTLLIAVAAIALSTVLVHDVWMIIQHNDPTRTLLEPVFTFLSRANVTIGGVVVGGLIVLVGLWLMVMSLRPRLRTHVRVASNTSIWMRPVDIARKSTAAVRQEFGVDDISSRADRTKLGIIVGDDGSGAPMEQSVREALQPELELLDPTPKVKVTVVPPAPKEFG